LERNFIKDKDYKILLLRSQEQKKQHGGHTKQTIMLNIKTFKLLCIKTETKKANEIHEYFVKLEEILNEVIQEECIELKQQLEDTNNNFDKKLIQQKALQREQILLKDYGSSGVMDNKDIMLIREILGDLYTR
jgi:phage anti-repressor protein